MRGSDVKLGDLPCVLQELVFQFAYNMPRDDVLRSLETILSIINMELPFFFFREKIWSWHYNEFLTNPVRTFLPIEYYNGRYCELRRRRNVLFAARAGLPAPVGEDVRFAPTLARPNHAKLEVRRAVRGLLQDAPAFTGPHHEAAGSPGFSLRVGYISSSPPPPICTGLSICSAGSATAG